MLNVKIVEILLDFRLIFIVFMEIFDNIKIQTVLEMGVLGHVFKIIKVIVLINSGI